MPFVVVGLKYTENKSVREKHYNINTFVQTI